MSLHRITGPVLLVEKQGGTSRAGNAYERTTARVLVGTLGVAEVTDFSGKFKVERGDVIDVAVEVTVYNGNLSCNYVGPFPADDPDHGLGLVASHAA